MVELSFPCPMIVDADIDLALGCVSHVMIVPAKNLARKKTLAEINQLRLGEIF